MIPYSMNPLGINNELSDLDILRQIRNANPTSRLPSLWLDSEDPHTQWEGVTWENGRVTGLNISNTRVKNIDLVQNILELKVLICENNRISNININSRNKIITASFNNNYLDSVGINKLLSAGFTLDEIGVQDPT